MSRVIITSAEEGKPLALVGLRRVEREVVGGAGDGAVRGDDGLGGGEGERAGVGRCTFLFYC